MSDSIVRCKKCHLNVPNPDSDKCQSCILLKQQKKLRCIRCMINMPNPGEDMCQTCYNEYKRQQLLLTPHPIAILTPSYPFAVMGPHYQFPVIQRQLQLPFGNLLSPSPSPYANWSSSRRVCCNRCGEMVPSGAVCCGKIMF